MSNELKIRPARDTSELLAKWRLEVVANEESHYATAKWLAHTQNFAGYPLAILNGVIATSVFATLAKDSAPAWKVTTAVLSVLAAILAAASAFGRFGERAEAHRRTAVKFGDVRWRLEQLIASADGGATECAKATEEIRQSLASIIETALPVPEAVWKATHDRIVEGFPPTGRSVV